MSISKDRQLKSNLLLEKERVRALNTKRDKLFADLKSGSHSAEIKQWMKKVRNESIANYPDNKKRPCIAIAGLGPSGLAGMINSFLNGSKVTHGIEPREFNRNQTFRFEPQFFETLLKRFTGLNINDLPCGHPLQSLIDTGIFHKRTTRVDLQPGFKDEEHWEISIQDMQHLLKTLTEIAQQVEPEALVFHNGYEYLNTKQNSVTIKKYKAKDDQVEKIDNIDLVIGCDGAKSKVRDHIGCDFKPTSDTKYHIAINFYQCDGLNGIKPFKNINNPKDAAHLNMSALKATGWQESHWPAQRIFFTGKDVYLGAEVSKDLYEELQALGKTIYSLRAKLKEGTENKSLNLINLKKDLKLAKNKLKEKYEKIAQIYLTKFATQSEIDVLKYRTGSHFAVQLEAASSKVGIHKENGMPGIVVGDASATAHYQTGSGALIGIQSAMQATDSLHHCLALNPAAIDNQGVEVKDQLKKYLPALDYLLKLNERELQRKVENFTDITTRLNADKENIAKNKELDIDLSSNYSALIKAYMNVGAKVHSIKASSTQSAQTASARHYPLADKAKPLSELNRPLQTTNQIRPIASYHELTFRKNRAQNLFETNKNLFQKNIPTLNANKQKNLILSDFGKQFNHEATFGKKQSQKLFENNKKLFQKDIPPLNVDKKINLLLSNFGQPFKNSPLLATNLKPKQRPSSYNQFKRLFAA